MLQENAVRLICEETLDKAYQFAGLLSKLLTFLDAKEEGRGCRIAHG